MMEKLRIFFIYGEYSDWLPPWANPALYRSAMKTEGLIHLFRIQPAVTNPFSGKKQYGDLVSVARPSCRFLVHVDDINRYALRGGHAVELAQHLLAQAAPRTRVQQEPHG